jgi:signal transduction histidine kinase
VSAESNRRLQHDFAPPGESQEELLKAYTQLRTEYHRRMMALTSAAHELRTPLTIIGGYGDVLLSEKAGQISPKQREILTEMQNTRSRLQHFIEDFLDFGSMVTDNLNFRFERNDIRACVEEVCRVWSPRFQEKLIGFYELGTSEVESFPFDYYKVQHIMSNLLHNALKFTPERGSVWVLVERHHWERRVTKKRVANDCRKEGKRTANCVRITVSDTGPGIPPEYHSAIFEDFTRAEGDDGPREGIGLGLAICRNLVEAHSGKIWVESASGAGSKFCFLLPFRARKIGDS